MKFVSKDKDYQEQFIVSFPSVYSALAGHRWDELRLRPKDVQALYEMRPEILREWLAHLLTKVTPGV